MPRTQRLQGMRKMRFDEAYQGWNEDWRLYNSGRIERASIIIGHERVAEAVRAQTGLATHFTPALEVQGRKMRVAVKILLDPGQIEFIRQWQRLAVKLGAADDKGVFGADIF